MSSRFFRNMWILILASAVATPALAQSQAINGSIEGLVRDSSGSVMPGVTITVQNTDTGLERVVITDAAGAYRAALLPIGTYLIRATLQGFKSAERAGVTLSAGQIASVGFELAVGAVSETVMVTADASIA
ncbi:MAG: carboxypeptidase regulatory-like domain-containing protein, partial [Acidobacteria bacterium]|nr:carboxypeptidase regulatory-like domain-containing protein [Acidobacteriota bacterium]